MSTMIPADTYRARATGYSLGETKNGDPQVAVPFRLTLPDGSTRTLTWFGFFTEKTELRTLESLRHCGWTGDDISTITAADLPDEVEVKVEHEDDQDGQPRARIRWVNATGGVNLKPMDEGRKATFAEKMKARIATLDAKRGGPPTRPVTPRHSPAPSPSSNSRVTDDDIPF